MAANALCATAILLVCWVHCACATGVDGPLLNSDDNVETLDTSADSDSFLWADDGRMTVAATSLISAGIGMVIVCAAWTVHLLLRKNLSPHHRLESLYQDEHPTRGQNNILMNDKFTGELKA